MGAWFLAILLTIKALATPIQLLNHRIGMKREGTRLTGRFICGMMAVEIVVTLVWAWAAVVAWDLARGI